MAAAGALTVSFGRLSGGHTQPQDHLEWIWIWGPEGAVWASLEVFPKNKDRKVQLFVNLLELIGEMESRMKIKQIYEKKLKF